MSEGAPRPERAGTPRLPAAAKGERLEDYQPVEAAGDPEVLLRNMSARAPDLGALLAAPDDEARAKVLATMPWQSRQARFAEMVTCAFQFMKASRHSEALRFERIRLELAKTDADRPLDSFFGHTYTRNVGDALTGIGIVQNEMGEYSLALASFLEAEEWFQKDEAVRLQAGITKTSEFDRLFHQEDFRAQTFAYIAGVYQQLGDLNGYNEYNLKAWQHSQRGADPQGRYEKLNALAIGARDRGDLDAALGAYWEALDLALQIKDSFITGKNVVQALAGAGAIYQDLGLYRRALELFGRSLEINQRGGHIGRQMEDLKHIAQVHAARGDVDAALQAYGDALQCCSVPLAGGAAPRALVWHHGSEQRQLVRLESAWRILLARARLLRAATQDAALDDLRLAVRTLETIRVRVIEEERRLTYQAAAVDLYDEIIDLYAEIYEKTGNRSHLEELFSYMEHAKARVLLEMLADQPLGKPLHTPGPLIEQETAFLAAADRFQKALEGADSSQETADALGRVQQQLEETWAAIVASDPEEGPEYVSLRKAEPASAREIQGVLASAGPQRVALVSYYITPKRLISVCLFSDRPDLSYHSEPVDRNELRSWTLVNPDDPPSIDLRLPYWMLDFPPITVAPIAKAVEGYDVVCLAPHDVLHSLPLHAFSAQPDGTPMVATSIVSYIPTGSLLRFCLRKRRGNTGNSLVAGNPDRPDQQPIPHSEAEALAVAQLLGTRALVGPDATDQAVAANCSAAEYIHVACHCKFSSTDPLDSALLLTGGDLTARNILGWRIAPDLCVLSACESGISKLRAGDELIGLVRALLFAGAPAVIVSLWNAYDTRTSEIMQDLYSQRIQNRESKAGALAQALRSQLQKGTPAAQWAPFVLIGDWR
ncbi:MAG: CHAT domain-containing tetratricopeptide repeat protein [Candidatus Solibacter sp.]